MSQTDDKAKREERLQVALIEYLEAAESGKPLDREAMLARYPELAVELSEFLSNRARIDELAAPLRPLGNAEQAAAVADQPTLGAAASGTPELGTKIRYFGDYELLEEIARGGMGVVYKARQTTLKRVVALKMILTGQLAGGEDVKRFYAEAEAAAKLEHPNIVPIFEIGQTEGEHYFSMALVDGESLAHRIARGVLSPREAAKVMQKVARAIAFAHVEGVVHRDVKPANILLDTAGEPHVTDFGLAKRVTTDPAGPPSIHQLTGTGQILGTPSYMPPEQASGRTEDIGPLADVYALGAVLYCALTGRPPFQAATPLDTLLLVLEQEPVPLRRLNAAIPRDLETIVMKCLEKEPRLRFGSAQELADEVERFLRDEPIRSRPPSPVERLARAARKNRHTIMRAAVVAAVSLVAGFGAFAGWGIYRDSQMGALDLTTSGYPLTAEVLDDTGEPIVPPFTVPTEQPVKVPRGEWHVRLSSPAQLSQTSIVSIHKGVHEFNVNLTDRQLWKPIGLEDSDHFQTLEFSDGSDVILVERRFEKMTLRRVDGGTATSIWETPIDQHKRPEGVAASDDGLDWMKFCGAFAYDFNVGEPPELVKPAPDLDGDGEPDVTWALRDATALLAFSGKDGRALWWSKTELGNDRAVVGMPVATDVDGDGRPDFIATCRAGNAIWMQAISGADGRTLWRREFAGWDPPTSAPGAQTGGQSPPYAVQLASVDGERRLVSIAAGKLVMFRVADGEPVILPTAPTVVPLTAPLLMDFDGDGSADLFAVEAVPQQAITLRCISLANGKELWSRSLTANVPTNYGESGRWPFAADLDGDGRPEVVVPSIIAGPLPRPRANPRYGIEVLDGSSGKVRWSQTLYMAGRQKPEFRQFLVAPDVDGDGHRELVVCSTGPSGGEWNQMTLFVDSLSGREGRRLGTWHKVNVGDLMPETMTDHFGGSAWGLAGGDGWPELLVTTIHKRHLRRDEPTIHVIALGSGREIGTTSDMSRVAIADLNGDGLEDLCYRRQTGDGGRLHAVAGTPPELWRRLGEVQPAQDFDGDGTKDFLGVMPEGAWTRDGWIDVISGRTGRVSRQLQLNKGMAGGRGTALGTVFLSPPYGDLDGDGTPDLITTSGTFRNRQGSPQLGKSIELPLRAVSCRSGETLWSQPAVELPDEVVAGVQHQLTAGNAVPTTDDLDGDGSPELIAAYLLGGVAGDGWQEWLAALDGRSGRIRFHVPLGKPIGTPRVVAVEARMAQTNGDTNGDGVRDLVMAFFTRREDDVRHCAIQARNGRDGSIFWTHALKMQPPTSLPYNAAKLSQPVVVDLNGDGSTEIVFVDYAPTRSVSQGGPAASTNLYELCVLNSKDGSVRWTRDLANSHLDIPTPTPIVAEFVVQALAGTEPPAGGTTNKHRIVCVPVVEGDKSNLAFFSSTGEPLSRLEADQEASPIANDLDGDGRDELIFVHGGKLRACSLDETQKPDAPARDGLDETQKPDAFARDGRQPSPLANASGLSSRVLWEWPPTGRLGQVGSYYRTPAISVLERPAGGKAVSILVRTWSTFTELDGPTGKPLRRGEGLPDLMEPGISLASSTWWLSPSRSAGTPIIVSQTHNTVARVALSWGATSRFAPSVAEFARIETPPVSPMSDPRLTRRLPWVPPHRRLPDWPLPVEFIRPPAFLALYSLVVLVVPGWLLWSVVGQRRWSVRGLLLVPLAFALGFTGYKFCMLNLAAPDFELHRMPLMPRLLMTLPGLPVLAFPAMLLAWAIRRRWSRLVWLLGSSLVLSVAISTVSLVIDSRGMDQAEHYSWNGWYLVLVIGSIAASALALAGMLLGRTIQSARAHLHRAARPT